MNFVQQFDFGPCQVLSAFIRILYIVKATGYGNFKASQPHLDFYTLSTKSVFGPLQTLSAPFGFYLFSRRWVFGTCQNLSSPILILYISRNYQFLDDPSLIHPIWILYILKKNGFSFFPSFSTGSGKTIFLWAVAWDPRHYLG